MKYTSEYIPKLQIHQQKHALFFLFFFFFSFSFFSRLISEAKLKGNFSGMKVAAQILITHLIFVDDVIIFGKISVEEWKFLHKILGFFCSASGMEVNPEKSIFFYSILSNDEKEAVSIVFGYLL